MESAFTLAFLDGEDAGPFFERNACGRDRRTQDVAKFFFLGVLAIVGGIAGGDGLSIPLGHFAKRCWRGGFESLVNEWIQIFADNDIRGHIGGSGGKVGFGDRGICIPCGEN